jgi:hypothetical protein
MESPPGMPMASLTSRKRSMSMAMTVGRASRSDRACAMAVSSLSKKI